MRQHPRALPEQTVLAIVSLVFISLCSSVTLEAQAPVDFSGTWEFDKAASSPGTVHATFEGAVMRKITQSASKFTYRDTYVRSGSDDWSTTDEVFNLDGKEQIKKDGANSRKKSALWSADKKTLTLTYKETYMEKGVAKELLAADSYKLSDEGKTLTIETFSKNQVTGETKTASVFRKK
jgi:hypothetical protein